MGLLLCVLAFTLSWFSARRSVGAGMVVVLAAGYSYGWLRAVVFDGFSHFIFDCAMSALYTARFAEFARLAQNLGLRPFYQWVALLIGWPFIVLLIGMAY